MCDSSDYSIGENIGNFKTTVQVWGGNDGEDAVVRYYATEKQICSGAFQYCFTTYEGSAGPVATSCCPNDKIDNNQCEDGEFNWQRSSTSCISDPWRRGQIFSEFIQVKGWVNPNAPGPKPSDTSGCSKIPQGISLDNSTFSFIVLFSDVQANGTILNKTIFHDIYPFNAVGTAYWVDQSKTTNDRFIVLRDIWGLTKGLLRLTADVEGRKTYNCTFRTIGITKEGDDYIPLNVQGQIQVDTLRNEVVNVIVTSLSENTFTASIRNITGEAWIAIREGRRAILIFNENSCG